MYKNLAETLRYCAKNGDCQNCPAEWECTGTFGDGLYIKAADAIEELSMKLHGDEAAILGMKREIERMVRAEKPRWIPVTERLPENCADVLAYIERNAWGEEDIPYRKREIAIAYHVNGMWHVDGCAGVVCIAWQPLPEPPEAAP